MIAAPEVSLPEEHAGLFEGAFRRAAGLVAGGGVVNDGLLVVHCELGSRTGSNRFAPMLLSVCFLVAADVGWSVAVHDPLGKEPLGKEE